MNKKHNNVIYETEEYKLSNSKKNSSVEDLIDLIFHNPLHTLAFISDIVKLTDK